MTPVSSTVSGFNLSNFLILPRGKMAITINDVAQFAGVSKKTVSRVINNQSEITETTREKVLNAIEILGYRPSKVAQALATKRTETLGLLIGEIANPYFSDVAQGILEVAQKNNYSVLIFNTNSEPKIEQLAINTLLDHNIDGVIVFPTWENIKWFSEIISKHIPIVFIDSEAESSGRIGQIMTMKYEGARQATQHLIHKGHQHIGMIACKANQPIEFDRVRGYRDALINSGIPYREELVILEGSPEIEDGYLNTHKLMINHPEISAIFCFNDLMAMGCIQACKDLGKRIPEDIAVVGYDDIRFSSLLTPSLTTIQVNKKELGIQAASLLIKMLKNPNEVYPTHYIETNLVVREST